jgi:hypothetical protein
MTSETAQHEAAPDAPVWTLKIVDPGASAVTLGGCPCPRVGRNCAGCILPPMGARPPITHPAGWLIASVAGPVWRFRGWAWGLIRALALRPPGAVSGPTVLAEVASRLACRHAFTSAEAPQAGRERAPESCNGGGAARAPRGLWDAQGVSGGSLAYVGQGT